MRSTSLIGLLPLLATVAFESVSATKYFSLVLEGDYANPASTLDGSPYKGHMALRDDKLATQFKVTLSDPNSSGGAIVCLIERSKVLEDGGAVVPASAPGKGDIITDWAEGTTLTFSTEHGASYLSRCGDPEKTGIIATCGGQGMGGEPATCRPWDEEEVENEQGGRATARSVVHGKTSRSRMPVN